MAEQKRAYVFQGPGFLRDTSGIDESLKSLGFEIQNPYVLPTQTPGLDLKLTRHDILIFRGPWDGIPEEMIYARQLGSKFKDIGKEIRAMPANERPTVIAVGRWVLALLHAEWCGMTAAEVSRLDWVDLPESFEGPWVEVNFMKAPDDYTARLYGRAMAEIPEKFAEIYLKTFDVRPVGWRHESFLHLFTVDPLALGEGSQLEGYGYENFENLKNNTIFLKTLLGLRNA